MHSVLLVERYGTAEAVALLALLEILEEPLEELSFSISVVLSASLLPVNSASSSSRSEFLIEDVRKLSMVAHQLSSTVRGPWE